MQQLALYKWLRQLTTNKIYFDFISLFKFSARFLRDILYKFLVWLSLSEMPEATSPLIHFLSAMILKAIINGAVVLTKPLAALSNFIQKTIVLNQILQPLSYLMCCVSVPVFSFLHHFSPKLNRHTEKTASYPFSVLWLPRLFITF